MEWNECRQKGMQCRADCLEACMDISEIMTDTKDANHTMNDLYVEVQHLGETCALVGEQIRALPLLALDDLRPLQGINTQLAECQTTIQRLCNALAGLHKAKKSFFQRAARPKENNPPQHEVELCRRRIRVILMNLQLGLQLLTFKVIYLARGLADEGLPDKMAQLRTTTQCTTQSLDQTLVQCANSYISQGSMLYALSNRSTAVTRSSEQSETMLARHKSASPINVSQQQKTTKQVYKAFSSSQLHTASDSSSNVSSLEMRPVASYTLHGVNIHACSHDQKLLACGITTNEGCMIEIRHFTTGQLEHTLIDQKHFNEVHCLAFNTDGTELASAHDNGVIRIWSMSNGSVLHYFRWRGPARPIRARCLTYIPHRQLLVSTHADSEVRVWNTDSGKKVCRRQMVAVAPSHDGKLLATIEKGFFGVIETTKKLSHLRQLDVHLESGYRSMHVAWARDGRLAIERGFGSYELFTHDFLRLSRTGPGRCAGISPTSTIAALAFLPNGMLVAVARDTDGMVFLCDVGIRRWYRLHDDESAPLRVEQLSFAGRMLITADKGGRHCVWDISEVLQGAREPAPYTEFYAPNLVV